MSKEMLNALDALEAEKGISKEIVIDALEAALVSAYKRHYGQAQNVEVEFDQKRKDPCLCGKRSNGRSDGFTVGSLIERCTFNQSSI